MRVLPFQLRKKRIFSTIFGQVYQQNFSFHWTIIRYLTKLPKSSKVYIKLLQSCKYFLLKNKYIFIQWLTFVDDRPSLQYMENWELENSTQKLWFINPVYNRFIDWLIFEKSTQQNLLSSWIPRFYRCDFRMLKIENQNISFYEFKFLTEAGNIQIFSFVESTVRYENDEIVPFESVIEGLQKLQNLTYYQQQNPARHFTPETAKKLSQLPKFEYCSKFNFGCFTEIFVLKDLHDFIKKNYGIFMLKLHFTVPDDYKNEFKHFSIQMGDIGKADINYSMSELTLEHHKKSMNT